MPPNKSSRSSLIPDVLSTLNTAAIKKRIDRLMTPKADGTYKVPAELVNEWQSGDQTRLINEFKTAGLDKELLDLLMSECLFNIVFVKLLHCNK